MTTVGRWSPNKIRRRILNGTWVSATPSKALISATPGPSAIITSYDNYLSFTYISTGTLNVTGGLPNGTADVFVVSGGSPGQTVTPATPPITDGGSGGAGGRYITSTGVTITANNPIPIVVGGSSTDSSFGPISSSGGSTGGAGGARSSTVGNPGTSGTSNNYRTGTPIAYAGGGGGGGGGKSSQPRNPGGSGANGGGNGGSGAYYFNDPYGKSSGWFPALPGTPGVANTGGGGGGGGGAGPGGGASSSGGDGGSGVVIVRFPKDQFRIE